MTRITYFIKCSFILALLLIGGINIAYAQLGAVKSYKYDKQSVTVTTTNGSISITPYSDSIVEVLPRLSDNTLSPKKSASVVMAPIAHFTVSDLPNSINIQLKTLTVNINKASSLVSFKVGRTTLLSEQSTLVEAGNDKIYTFFNPKEESFYGAGERGQSVDLQGDTLIMYNKQNYAYGKGDRTSQMNITMPYYLSSKGYGVFFDDYSLSSLILGSPIKYVTSIKNPVPYFFILGSPDNMGAVVKNFTRLVGRQEIAPFWALGYITSKYGYKTQEETMAVVDTLKRSGYPLDAVVLDLYWYGKETDMGRFKWNKEQWPNPEKMIGKLNSQGINLITISQPYLNKIGAIDNYNLAASKGMLVKDNKGNVNDVHTWVGDAGMLDVSNPFTKEWMWQQYDRSLKQGVGGLWGDLGEPEVHPSTMRHYSGETAEEYHNRYGNDWSAIIYDGIKTGYPKMRPMLMMRGGTAGLQRYSVFPWSTDVSRSWGGLQAQIPIMINSSLSGLGYMSHDVGGFAVDKENPVNPELYARWLQMGLFSPVFRTHSTVDAEPYHYTEYQDMFRKIVNDRYKWLPYNYTLAYNNAISGAPFVRPMNYYEPNNKALSNIEDQYFWGDELIVAPVINQGDTSRSVVLPQGIWYDFNNPSVKYVGPTTINYSAPLNIIPLFVRAGSFIPFADYKMESTKDYDPQKITINYYPLDGKSSYTLYEDDRQSPNSVAKSQFSTFEFTADNSKEKLHFFIDIQGNGYKGMPRSHILTFVIPDIDKPRHVVVDKHELANATTKSQWYPGAYFYDISNRTLYFKTYINNDLNINIYK